MKRDTKLFSEDFKLDISGEEMAYDTSHIYTGEIFGKWKCLCGFMVEANLKLKEREFSDSLKTS